MIIMIKLIIMKLNILKKKRTIKDKPAMIYSRLLKLFLIFFLMILGSGRLDNLDFWIFGFLDFEFLDFGFGFQISKISNLLQIYKKKNLKHLKS